MKYGLVRESSFSSNLHQGTKYSLQASFKEREAKFQSQTAEARSLIEQLEVDKAMAVAETKQQMHEAMESKDVELQNVRTTYQQLKLENEELQEKIGKLEKSGEKRK